jgi:nicotinate-nucleotide pyrophosphorylase (carboxylating)
MTNDAGQARLYDDVPLERVYAQFASTGLVRRVLELARDEDMGSAGDITTRVCDAAWREVDGANASSAHAVGARVVARSAGVIAGLATLPELVGLFAPACEVRALAHDGDPVAPDDARRGAVAEVFGPSREVLAMERTLLNVLGRLSGIATRTRAFVDAIPPGCRARMCDTRKTTPGLRVLEKYAVRCGGGWCHRIGLHDAVLIKDNHIAGLPTDRLAGFVARAASLARALAPPPRFIEVEVDTIEQFDALLTLPTGTIDVVLLDNMGDALVREAVSRRDRLAPSLLLEASGGVTLATVAPLARTGVDRISAGTLTHGSVWLDLGLDAITTG